MKKNGLVRLFALASCVSLLAGCGTKADPKLVVKDHATTFHLGDVIDVDKFVSVSGSNKSFEISLYKSSKELASVKDHKITIKGEGDIKFKVTLGDLSETIKVTSIAKMREDLIKILGGFTNGYTIAGSESGDVYIHDPEYAERLFLKHSVSGFKRSGFLSPEFAGATYEFEWDVEDSIVVNPKISAKSTFNVYTYLNVDMTLPERSVENNLELYSLNDKQIKSFAKNCLLSTYDAFPVSIPMSGGQYDESSSTYAEVDAKITKVAFTLTESDGEQIPAAVVYAKYGTKTFLADALFFFNKDTDTTDDPYMRYFIDSKYIPFDPTIKNLFKSIIEVSLPASNNFVADYRFGWVDGSGNDIAEPDLDGTIFSDGLPIGKLTRVFYEDAIFNIVDNEAIRGVVSHNESEVTTVYSFKQKSDLSGHELFADPDFADFVSPYDEEYYSLAYLVSDEAFPDDMFYVKSTKNGGTPDDPSDDVYTLAGNLTKYYNFVDSICICEDDLCELCSVLYKYLQQGRDIYDYFTFSLDVSNTGEINFSFKIQWSEGVNYIVTFNLHQDGTGQYDSIYNGLMAELFA